MNHGPKLNQKNLCNFFNTIFVEKNFRDIIIYAANENMVHSHLGLLVFLLSFGTGVTLKIMHFAFILTTITLTTLAANSSFPDGNWLIQNFRRTALVRFARGERLPYSNSPM